MSARSQKDKGQKQNAHQLILAELLKEEANRYCSDCRAKGPRWASWNLGVFLCIRCAGIHRNLGVHISRVKSVNLDSWTPEQMDSIQQWGNQRAAEFWECNLPKDFPRPQTDSAVEAFIRNKYERKQYLKKDGLPPSRATNNSSGKEGRIIDKAKKRREKKDESITIAPLKSSENNTVIPPPSSGSQTIAQQRPHSNAALVKAPEPSKPAALVDLFALDMPAPATGLSASAQIHNISPNPPVAQPAKSSLENELIDFGAFQQSTFDSGFSQPQLNAQVPQNSEESLLKDDSLSSKSTKDSIMALYTPSTQCQQPQMYGIPGGMYITPQQPVQQPHLGQQPAGFNRMAGFPPQSMQMGMSAHSQQSFMQQHQQVAQIQKQMQNMRLKQQMPPQQPNMYSSPSMFGQPPAMASWVPQQPMSFPQQQHAQYITTGPSAGNIAYTSYAMGSAPRSGHTLSHQLWK